VPNGRTTLSSYELLRHMIEPSTSKLELDLETPSLEIAPTILISFTRGRQQ